jgi:hypothetical protein
LPNHASGCTYHDDDEEDFGFHASLFVRVRLNLRCGALTTLGETAMAAKKAAKKPAKKKAAKKPAKKKAAKKK